MVTDLLLGANDEVMGWKPTACGIQSPSVVLAEDFPGGRIWVGNKSMPAGQAEFAAEADGNPQPT